MKTGRWHFLFTQPREGLPPNPWTSGLFFGHVFVMKFLGTVDPDGEQSYRDILPDAATSDHEEYFLDKFATGILGGLARALAPILAQ